MLNTPSSWPSSGGPRGWPLSASQSRTVLSTLAEARRLPSGLKATLNTIAAWPRKIFRRLRVCQQCRKERVLRLRRRLGLIWTPVEWHSRADGFLREQQGEVDAVFFLFAAMAKPLAFDSCASRLATRCCTLATKYCQAANPATSRTTTNPIRVRRAIFFWALAAFFCSSAIRSASRISPLLLFFLGGLAGLLCRATGVQISPFD